MPCPSHRPYAPMLIIRPDSLPRFWWLFPWTVCRQLHKNAVALRSLCDRQDALLKDKAGPRPRWSIWINGLPGPDRKYLFLDNDGQSEAPVKSVVSGKNLHFYDNAFTSIKNAEDAIIFCDRLNKKEIK